MNPSLLRALGLSLLVGSMTGLAAVELGWFLSGSYGAMVAFFLCPLPALGAASLTMAWIVTSNPKTKD